MQFVPEPPAHPPGTLTLSGNEIAALITDLDTISLSTHPALRVLHSTLTRGNPDTPLKRGDKLRITGHQPRGTSLDPGDVVTVVTPGPDVDGDIYVRDQHGSRIWLDYGGPNKGWGRIDG